MANFCLWGLQANRFGTIYRSNVAYLIWHNEILQTRDAKVTILLSCNCLLLIYLRFSVGHSRGTDRALWSICVTCKVRIAYKTKRLVMVTHITLTVNLRRHHLPLQSHCFFASPVSELVFSPLSLPLVLICELVSSLSLSSSVRSLSLALPFCQNLTYR